LTIQDLGSIGELIAALVTVLTLGYLAIQLKMNTNVLRSQTFQQSSMDMSLTANAISSSNELASILIKAKDGLDILNPVERLRFHFWMLVAIRRFEAIYIQGVYGSIDPVRIKGFEKYIITLLASGGSNDWLKITKSAFSRDFVQYADEKLSSGNFDVSVHPA
jgi:hypothetical protein